MAHRAGDVTKIGQMRSLSLSVLGALVFAAAGPGQNPPAKKSALDKPTLERYVRHLWVLNDALKVDISDPKPSQLPGLEEVTVHISQGAGSQDVTLYVTKDGSRILQGSAYDINQNPFKPDLEKLKTEFQPSMGTPGATVVIVEFSDFECPYCKEEAKLIRQNLLTAFPTQVRLYFREFPLEQIHPWAKAAAMAARCVFNQNPAAFWTYHDWIFEHQEQITAANLKDQVLTWAKSQKDIDGLQLGRCIDTRATEPDIDKNIAEGRALAVTGTPTLFINGRHLGQAVDWPTLRSIIENEIEYQKIAKDAGEDCGCDVKLNIPGLPPAGVSPMDPHKKKQ